MPLDRYIKIFISRQAVNLGKVEDLPLSISYQLEDRENYQQKKSSTALNITIPATIENDRIANTFRNPSVEDMSEGKVFRGNQPAVIEAGGYELLVGKAFLVSARHASTPIDVTYNFYGGNGDWLVDLKELTLFDCYQDISFVFTKDLIVNSWDFDGSLTYRDAPYVFAPVRYGDPLGTQRIVDPVSGSVTSEIEDYNMFPEYLKPAMSKYWTLVRGFKTLGYRVKSDFMDLPYFRRQVMPWTWGAFLTSPDTQLDNLDFLAKSAGDINNLNAEGEYVGFTAIMDVKAYNDSVNGAFDNSGSYDYNASTYEMTWTYLPQFNYGTLIGVFHFMAFVNATATKNSAVEMRIQWFKNGVRVMHDPDNGNGTTLVNLDAATIGPRASFIGQVDDFAEFEVNPGDVITAKIYGHVFNSGAGYGALHFTIDAFELDYFRIPLGGTINFGNYTGFKKYKFLDFLSGVIDEFNLCVGTDPINKVVYFEPMHPFFLRNDPGDFEGTADGRFIAWFNGKYLDWGDKQDLTKISEMQLFSDYEREVSYRYKDDPADGALKVVQDRNVNTLALCKYVLPDRFKTGKREIENRFFAPTMHMDFVAWKGLSADAAYVPQLVILVPENISQTSRDAAQNTFLPKSCYYKGADNTIGWIFDGEAVRGLPLMFAALYRPGGELEPILSYADEIMNPDPNDQTKVIGRGLFRRFHLQRLEIMRNGQYYRTFFHLNNYDIANSLHREHIILQGQKWEIIEINNYKPLKEETTEVLLRRHYPIMRQDAG